MPRQSAVISLEAVASGQEHSDARSAERLACRTDVTLRLAVRSEFHGLRGLVRDVSTGGIALLLCREMPTGTGVALELLGDKSGEGVSRLARVAHARPHPTPPNAPWLPSPRTWLEHLRRRLGIHPAPEQMCWFVGLEFDAPLSEAEFTRVLSHTLPGGRPS